MVKDAIEFFGRNLVRSEKAIINKGIKLMLFGIKATLITYRGEFFVYGREKDKDDKGLTIGGYESTYGADLVGAYVLKKLQRETSAQKFSMGHHLGFCIYVPEFHRMNETNFAVQNF